MQGRRASDEERESGRTRWSPTSVASGTIHGEPCPGLEGGRRSREASWETAQPGAARRCSLERRPNAPRFEESQNSLKSKVQLEEWSLRFEESNE